MHFLIFIPNKNGPAKSNLRDAGLADLLRPNDHTALWSDLNGRGPGEQPGQIWTWGDSIPAYLPDKQTWTEDRLKRYWYGVNNDSPPTPADLLRQNPIAGIPQTMADGREWLIPNVLQLPAVFDLDDQGEPIMVPHAHYKSFADECGWAFEAVADDFKGGPQPDWKRSLLFAAMALSINYRLTMPIAIGMGLLSVDVLPEVLMKAIDVPKIRKVIEDVEKKEEASIQNG